MATFGYTSIGATDGSSLENTARGSKATATEAGTAISMSWYTKCTTAVKKSKATIYAYVSDTDAGALLATSSEDAGAVDNNWRTGTISYVFSAISYFLEMMSESAGGGNLNVLDTGGASVSETGLTYPTFPDPFAETSNSTFISSIYVTYTPAGSPSSSISPSPSSSQSPSSSISKSPSSSVSLSISPSPSASQSPSSSISLSPSSSVSSSISPSPSSSQSPSSSVSLSPSPSPSLSLSPSPSSSVSLSISPSPSASQSPSSSISLSISLSPSASQSPSSSVSSSASPSSSSGRLKYWNGSSWVLKSIKYYNGSSFVEKVLKYWTGVAWAS